MNTIRVESYVSVQCNWHPLPGSQWCDAAPIALAYESTMAWLAGQLDFP
jgi:hypothetical protein